MIAVACKKDDPTPTPPATTPTTTPPVVTKSSAKDITKFSFAALSPVVDATIDATAKTITATVPAATDVTKLVPTITISDKATVSPASGVATDFSKEVSYTVTAEDASVVVWKVGISKAISTVGGTVNSQNVIYLTKELYDIKDQYSKPTGSGRYIVAIDALTGQELANFASTKKEKGASLYSQFYFNKSLIIIGDEQSKNELIDAVNGKLVTSLPNLFTPYALSAFENSTFYCKSGSQGNITAFDLVAGTTKWSIDNSNSLICPVAVDGLVYVSNVYSSSGGDSRSLVCYDVNKNEKWRFKYPQNFLTVTNPSVMNGMIYCTFYGVVYALDAKTGVKKWEQKTEANNIEVHPTSTTDLVYVAGDKKVYALDATTGAIKWSVLTEAIIKTVTLGSDYIYATTGFPYQIIAFDTKTGTQKWVLKNDISSPVFANGVLYGDEFFKGLMAIDGATGNIKWQLKSTYQSNITTTLDTYEYSSLYFCVVIKEKMYFPSRSGMQQ